MPHMTEINTENEIIKKERVELEKECAQISYKELERFFAKGALILVEKDLNIIDVAEVIQEDNSKALETWIQKGQVVRVHDEHAIKWSKNHSDLLAVTMTPWVIVQELN
jgi:hypothetical protein